MPINKKIIAELQARTADLLADEKGTTFIEYTLIVALISLALLAFFGNTADSMSGTFSDVASEIDPANF